MRDHVVLEVESGRSRHGRVSILCTRVMEEYTGGVKRRPEQPAAKMGMCAQKLESSCLLRLGCACCLVPPPSRFFLTPAMLSRQR